jgi:DNA-binding transcriptional LysR family regulator
MQQATINAPRLEQVDFNLLIDLDALLREGSVAGAARRLHLSAPAMSRRLARLRTAFGDPLFVPAGRGLVPTERALALQPRVAAAIAQVRDVLMPETVDVACIERSFTIRGNDGFAGAWAARLAAALAREAPGVTLHFLARASRDTEALRSGAVDLDLGLPKTSEPDIHARHLFEAGFVGVVRHGHPLGAHADEVGAGDFVAWQHIAASPGRRSCAPVDEALARLGLQRRVAIVAPGFQAALMMALASDLVAVMPAPFVRWNAAHLPLRAFALPVDVPPVPVAQRWHARHHADPVHRWLRGHVQALCAAEAPQTRGATDRQA